MGTTASGTLRDKAVALAGRGKHKKALELYLQLESLEPQDGGWSRRVGEMYRQLGDTGSAIISFGRACDRYADRGFLIKAVAVCKIILRIDPDHVEAQERLVAYNEERGIRLPSSARASSLASPAAGVNAPLEAIALHRALVDASPRMSGAEPTGITDIPLDLEIPLELDLGTKTKHAMREALQQTPLFSTLSQASLRRLIEKVRLVELPAGQALFHEGDTGTTLYVVAEGRIEVASEGPPRTVLAQLHDGDFFGEISLVTDQRRTASAQAITDSELLAIERNSIGEMIAEEPEVLKVLLHFLRGRLVDNLVRTSQLFAPFVGSERQSLVSRFRFLEVQAGSVLVAEGEVSPALFIAMSGQLSVTRSEAGEVATLGSGDVFGEMSLLAHAGAVATVKALSKCLVLELPAGAFRELIMTHPQILAFVGDLASERERELSGEEHYEELHLDFY